MKLRGALIAGLAFMLSAIARAADVDIANLMSQAEAEAQSGQLDEALAHYNTVLSMDVPFRIASLACQNRGNIYRLKGDHERALRDYEEAIRLNPANAGAYINRGLDLAENGDYEAALRDYDQAIRFDPKKYKAFYGRSFTYGQLGNLEAAWNDINETLRLNPQFAAGYVYRGGLAIRKKEWKSAETDYEVAARLDPNLTEAQMGLAQLALQQKKYSQAVAILEKLLTHELPAPPRAAALNALAWLRATCPVRAIRDGRRSVDEAREACDLSNWESFAAVDTFAAALAEKGEFENAAAFQWFALDLSPAENREDAQSRLHLYEKRQPYRETQAAREKPATTPTPSRPRQEIKPHRPADSAEISSPRLPPS